MEVVNKGCKLTGGALGRFAEKYTHIYKSGTYKRNANRPFTAVHGWIPNTGTLRPDAHYVRVIRFWVGKLTIKQLLITTGRFY